MSDAVVIILILCVTYLASTIINRCNHKPGKYSGKRKDGGKP